MNLFIRDGVFKSDIVEIILTYKAYFGEKKNLFNVICGRGFGYFKKCLSQLLFDFFRFQKK
jgi:hypothetical protein